MLSATVIADSITPIGCRVTTFELVCPKQMVAQFNTHGMVRRDSASSRAIPTLRIMGQVQHNPYLPAWKYRQRGMQPAGLMSPEDALKATRIERNMRAAMLYYVGQLEAINAAKEDINRYLEAWMWTTIVTTATEWDNYLNLRDHSDAQDAHAQLAHQMRVARDNSVPILRDPYAQDHSCWHLPYISDEERETLPAEVLPPVSASRCAAVSYFRQGSSGDLERELQRARGLVADKHWSPLEMPCRAMPDDAWAGPFQGWLQLRKHYAGESGSPNHGSAITHARWTAW